MIFHSFYRLCLCYLQVSAVIASQTNFKQLQAFSSLILDHSYKLINYVHFIAQAETQVLLVSQINPISVHLCDILVLCIQIYRRNTWGLISDIIHFRYLIGRTHSIPHYIYTAQKYTCTQILLNFVNCTPIC